MARTSAKAAGKAMAKAKPKAAGKTSAKASIWDRAREEGRKALKALDHLAGPTRRWGAGVLLPRGGEQECLERARREEEQALWGAQMMLARQNSCADQLRAMKTWADFARLAQMFAKKAESAAKELDGAYSKDQFPNQFRAASLDPALMKNLKKECGDSFLNKVILFTMEQEQIVLRMEDALLKFTVTQDALSRKFTSDKKATP